MAFRDFNAQRDLRQCEYLGGPRFNSKRREQYAIRRSVGGPFVVDLRSSECGRDTGCC
jgi:hypothetical protein